MARIAFVNSRYCPASAAALGVEDRATQFADAVYEVWPVRDGRLWDADAHFARLFRSLTALRIDPPMTAAALAVVLREMIRRNAVRHGYVYLQISRGVAPRDHAFPKRSQPSVIVQSRSVDLGAVERRRARGIKVASAPDQRWARCDIKTTGLLANVLARQAAVEHGATEAWLVDTAGLVTEGASSTAWIVDAAGMIRTRPADAAILDGVTRRAVLAAARRAGFRVEERAFSLEEAHDAREAFATSAGLSVTAVVEIDGASVADGQPGPVAHELQRVYVDAAQREAKPFPRPLRRVGDRPRSRYSLTSAYRVCEPTGE